MPKMTLTEREKSLVFKQREEDKIWNGALTAAYTTIREKDEKLSIVPDWVFDVLTELGRR